MEEAAHEKSSQAGGGAATQTVIFRKYEGRQVAELRADADKSAPVKSRPLTQTVAVLLKYCWNV